MFPYQAPFISYAADKEKLFSYRLGLNFVLLFEELDHHNLILLFCFIFFQGDLWAESSFLGYKIHFYACMEGEVYDVTDWAACQVHVYTWHKFLDLPSLHSGYQSSFLEYSGKLQYLHWSVLKVPKACCRVRGSKNVFILTIWWLQVIILGAMVFDRCLPLGNKDLPSPLFQCGISFCGPLKWCSIKNYSCTIKLGATSSF